MGSLPSEKPMSDADDHRLFCYGSLLLSDTWEALIGRVPEVSSGILRGYRRRNIRGMCLPAVYPVDVEEGESGFTVGQIALISTLEFQALIMSKGAEDDEFTIKKVKVQSIDSEDMDELEAACYVWKEEYIDG